MEAMPSRLADRRRTMRTLRGTLLILLGVAVLIGWIADPIGQAIAIARLQHVRLRIVTDTEVPAVAAAATGARAAVASALERYGVRVAPDGEAPRSSLELEITVHDVARCGEAGTPGAPAFLEEVDVRLCDVPEAGTVPPPGACATRWLRSTPLRELPPGAPVAVTDQILDLVTEFATDHRLVARPSLPPSPRRLG